MSFFKYFKIKKYYIIKRKLKGTEIMDNQISIHVYLKILKNSLTIFKLK